jgi:hypothetical protein
MWRRQTKTFLALLDDQQRKTKAQEPPEAALILAYSCSSLENIPRGDVGFV